MMNRYLSTPPVEITENERSALRVTAECLFRIRDLISAAELQSGTGMTSEMREIYALADAALSIPVALGRGTFDAEELQRDAAAIRRVLLGDDFAMEAIAA